MNFFLFLGGAVAILLIMIFLEHSSITFFKTKKYFMWSGFLDIF